MLKKHFMLCVPSEKPDLPVLLSSYLNLNPKVKKVDFGKNELDTVNAIISKIRGINTSIPACYIGKRTDYPDWATEPCYKNIALDDEYFRYPQIGIELSWCNTHFDGRDLTQKELNKVIKEMKRYYNRCIRFKHRDGRYLTIKDTFIKLQSAGVFESCFRVRA